MSDLISRQAVLALPRDCIRNMKGEIVEETINVDAIKTLPSVEPERIQNNAVHLCDSCQYTYVTCPSHGNDAVFGDGKGNDNICACNKYQPISAQPEQQNFEKQIYAMFDHIWDCEIDHPVFQDTVGDLMGAVIQCHKGLPPAKPEKHIGYWFIDERPESDREVICSICEQPVFMYHKLDFDYRPRYCPNCGADMRGGEDG